MFTKICKSNKCIFSLNLLPFSVEGSNFGLGGTRNPHYKNGNTSVATIVISKIKIPPYVIVGQTVHLYCLFELKNGTDLYTLKWFKDGAEFYRSVPRASVRKNRRLIFPMPGVRVDFENSKVRVIHKRRCHFLNGRVQKLSIDYRSYEGGSDKRLVKDGAEIYQSVLQASVPKH